MSAVNLDPSWKTHVRGAERLVFCRFLRQGKLILLPLWLKVSAAPSHTERRYNAAQGAWWLNGTSDRRVSAMWILFLKCLPLPTKQFTYLSRSNRRSSIMHDAAVKGKYKAHTISIKTELLKKIRLWQRWNAVAKKNSEGCLLDSYTFLMHICSYN